MAYQRDNLEAREYEFCYVCGEKTWTGRLCDLAGPQNDYDLACEECCKHGARRNRPKNWTRKQTQEVLAKRKAAEPPPPPPKKLSPAEKAARDKTFKMISRLFM